MAVIDESVVQITPDFTGFKAKLEAGVAAASKGVQAEIKVVADVKGFAASITKGLREYGALDRVRAKIGLDVDTAHLADTIRKQLAKYKPLTDGNVRARIRLDVDCDDLKAQLTECLSGQDTRAKVHVDTEVDRDRLAEVVSEAVADVKTPTVDVQMKLLDDARARTDALRRIEEMQQAVEDFKRTSRSARLPGYDAATEQMREYLAEIKKATRQPRAAFEDDDWVEDFREAAEEATRLQRERQAEGPLDKQRRNEKDAAERKCREDLKRVRDCEEQKQHLRAVAEERGHKEHADRARKAMQEEFKVARTIEEEREHLHKQFLQDAYDEDARFNEKRDRLSKQRERDEKRAADDRRRNSLFGRLSRAGKGLTGIGEGPSLLDLGRPGVKPINALIGAAVALSPALLAVGSSAGMASTSLVALGSAALGAVSVAGVLIAALAGVTEALKLQGQAAEGNERAAAQLGRRLEAMTAPARALFDQLSGLKQEMAGFARLAQQATLPGLVTFLRLIRQRPAGGASTLDVFKAGMLDLGRVISDTTSRAGAFFGSEFFKNQLGRMAANNSAAFSSLGAAVVTALEPITRLLSNASPLLVRFADWVNGLSESFASFIGSFSDQQLSGFFARAGDEAARWVDLFGNILGIVRNIAMAAFPAGSNLVERLREWTQAMQDFTGGPAFAKFTAFFDWFGRLDYAAIIQGITGIAVGLIALKAAMAGVGAIGALSQLAAGNPLPLFLAAIAAAIIAIGAAATWAYTNFKPFRDMVNAGFAVIGRAVAAFVENVLPLVREGMTKLEEVWRRNEDRINAVGALLAKWVPFVAEVLGTIVGYIARNFISGIAAAIEVLLDLAEVFLTVAEQALKFARVLASSLGWLFTKLAQAADMVGLEDVMPFTADEAKKFTADVNSALTSGINNIADTLADMEGKINHRKAEMASQVPALAFRDRTEQEKKEYEAALKRGRDAENAQRAAARARDILTGAIAHQTEVAKANREAIAAADRELRDAQLAARDARWDVDEARQAIVDNQRDQKKAQEELTKARKEARQELIELRQEVQGLAHDEQEARYKLAVAREVRKGYEYATAVDPLLKQRMDLDVAGAEQELNEVITEGKAKRDELAEAERKGVGGSDRVKAAKERLAEAQRDQLRLERDLIKAQDDARRAAEDLTLATQRRRDASAAAKKAADEEAKAVDAARKKYIDLKAAQDKVPAKKATAVDVTPMLDGKKLSMKSAGKIPPERLSEFESQVPKQAGTKRSTPPGGSWLPPDTGKGVFATGGAIWGPGTATSDSVPIAASAGEHMWTAREVNAVGGHSSVYALRRAALAGQLRGYADGGPILDRSVGEAIARHMGGQYAVRYSTQLVNALGAGLALPEVITKYLAPAGAVRYPAPPAGEGIAPWSGVPAEGLLGVMQKWARQQAGKVYRWAAVGPQTYDCSGLVGNLWAIATGNKLYKRYFTTHNMANQFGFRRGRGKFTVYLHPEHTAANIAGMHAEAYGGNGTPLAIGHVGTPLSYYTSTWHLPGLAKGGPVDPRILGADDRWKNLSFLLAGWPEPTPAAGRRVGIAGYDTGGVLPPGVTMAVNRTGKPETVRTAAQEDALRHVRLDSRDLKTLAFYIAQASQRPITMDGRRVAEVVASHTYLPPGGGA